MSNKNDIEIMCHADENTIPTSVTKPTIHFIKGGGSDVEVIDALNSTSRTAALSANQGKVLRDEIVDLDDRATRLLWSGNLTLSAGTSDYINEASMYPELFQDTGLFALKIEVMSSPINDFTPFITTVFIDTEGSGLGSTNFSGTTSIYSTFGSGGALAWGTIEFHNLDGYVKFYDGQWYEFEEMVADAHLTLNAIEEINILSIHRISRTEVD